MDEKSFNDDVTIVGGSPSHGASSGDFGRTMNDDRTMVDGSSDAPRQSPSAQIEEPILAEIDQFALVKKLGEGAAGKVYKAIDRETGVKVAVKGLPVSASETTKARIKANFQIVTKLNHPNIAAAKEYHVIRHAFYSDGTTAEDFKVKDGDALLVMQFAEGKTLAEWRREQESIPQTTVLDIVRQIASALDEAHRQGIIHRDVKPANINIHMRDNGEIEVKLLDFGIAAEGPVEGVAGTRTYMAPEQSSGGVQTKAIDIYALGKIARELLTGSPTGENDSRLDVPERNVIARALSESPDDRYASGGDFYDDLENAILEGGVKLPPEFRELLRTFNSDELSDPEKFDSYADSLNEFAIETIKRRKVSTQFTNDYDIYRFLFTDAALLKHVDRLRARRRRRRKNPSSVRVTDVMSRAAFKAACEGVSFLSDNPMPDDIRRICDSISYPPDPPKAQRESNLKSITLSVTRLEDPVFYGCEIDSDNADEEFKVDPLKCGVRFAEFKKVFREGDRVLITNPVEVGDCWQGSELVLEPDFLLSPQALGRASVWGQGSLMYLLSAFSREWKTSAGADENSRPSKYRLLLGNMGDDCLAEEVVGGDEPQTQLASRFFESNALDAVAHEVDGDWKEEAEFIRQNIHREIAETMPKEFGVRHDQWQIEAPFVSPILGVTGRMDAFAPNAATQNRSVVFELKSGKWKIFRGHSPKDEHLYQPWIYGDMLYYSLGIGRQDVWPRLYYSKRHKDRDNTVYNGHSFAITAGRENIRTVMNFRNKVINVWRLMRENRLRAFFDSGNIRVDSFRAPSCGETLWNKWLKGQAEELVRPLLQADDLAKDYFWRFLAFEAAEDFCAWCGEGERSGGKSLSWKMSLSEKQQAGMVYSGLVPVSHALDDKGREQRIDFDRSLEATNAFCSLREGDSVFLYEQASETSDPSNSRIFGGYVESFTEDGEDGTKEIRICLDPPQTPAVFTPDPGKRYIVEASLANRGRNEYKGLYMFMAGCPRRRQLLLNQARPCCNPPQPVIGDGDERVKDIVARARAAMDWFLVWGPPGTGKTSHLLHCYVEQVMATQGENVLMLAYTNRAVDEICDMLDKAGWDYWRIGAPSHCNKKYRKHIPGSAELRFDNREALLTAFESIKVVVGTLSSLGADHSILHLGKRFDSAVVDEASQILEPQLLSLFCAPDDDAPREPLIGKFVLVGDDKQLPAVVQQSVETSAVTEESLRAIHLTNCRNSLFMRLKKLSGQREELFGKMNVQYRMHEDIARFPNRYFYGNLGIGDSARQTGPLPPAPFRASPFEKYVLSTRTGFFPTIAPEIGKNAKSNDAEAFICAEIVRVLLDKGTKHSYGGRQRLTAKDIGIIAPFRSQLATVRVRLEKALGDANLVRDIMTDTVERYQGSERTVIIFSAVVSKKSQFGALSPCEDEERSIESDKKLNVAITRAKEQFFLIGDRRLLLELPSYKALIDEIETSYGSHYAREPLARYAALRESEAQREAEARKPKAASGPAAHPSGPESCSSTAKKRTLWSRFLDFIGSRISASSMGQH
ncbi:MAG: protein kinase [Kiritimatiellae bacterium]|nr:protein kinase [Kiritimatiellia bacterium]